MPPQNTSFVIFSSEQEGLTPQLLSDDQSNSCLEYLLPCRRLCCYLAIECHTVHRKTSKHARRHYLIFDGQSYLIYLSWMGCLYCSSYRSHNQIDGTSNTEEVTSNSLFIRQVVWQLRSPINYCNDSGFARLLLIRLYP